jgi:hypothetical protein
MCPAFAIVDPIPLTYFVFFILHLCVFCFACHPVCVLSRVPPAMPKWAGDKTGAEVLRAVPTVLPGQAKAERAEAEAEAKAKEANAEAANSDSDADAVVAVGEAEIAMATGPLWVNLDR